MNITEPSSSDTPAALVGAKHRLHRDRFRHVIGHFASGVTVVTSRDGAQCSGSTASAVSSLSLDPAMLLVCLRSGSFTERVISKVGQFAVNILREEQGDLALQFASGLPDKFAGIEVVNGRHGLPLLADALAHIECRVVETATGGTHTIFLAQATSARASQGAPLIHYRGRFAQLVSARFRRNWALRDSVGH